MPHMLMYSSVPVDTLPRTPLPGAYIIPSMSQTRLIHGLNMPRKLLPVVIMQALWAFMGKQHYVPGCAASFFWTLARRSLERLWFFFSAARLSL